MRTAFIRQLIEEARKNDRIYLLVGDLGYNVVESFANEFPNRFKNVGIAEQNMAGVAAGLAMSGFIVYFYSIGNFPTLRCIEQIRNDIAYHHANVRVVAVGGGYAYADLGATHHATEAIGMMRTIPNMVVCSPADPIEAQALTTFSVDYNGPMYIQLGKAGEKIIHKDRMNLQLGDIPYYKLLPKSNDAVIVSGSIAAEIVENDTIKDMDIYTMPFVKPLNITQLKGIAERYEYITVIEEHQKSAGIGAAVVEQISDLYAAGELLHFPKIKRVAINDVFSEISGTQQYLRKMNGLLKLT